MPKHLNKTLGLVFAFLAAGAFAQEDRPQPGSVTVPVQVEKTSERSDRKKEDLTGEDGKTKWAYIRIWNFSGLKTKRALGFFLGPKAAPLSPDAVWLGRCVRYGTVGDYIRVPVQSYQLVVKDDPIESFQPNQPLKFEASSDLGRNFPIELKENGYATIMVQDEGDQLKMSLLDDSGLNSGLYTMRAINFTDLKSVSIDRVSADKRLSLFKDLPGNQMQTKEFSAPEMMDLELLFQDEKGFPMKQFSGADFKGNLSVTILIFYDKYGRVTFRCYSDAPRSS